MTNTPGDDVPDPDDNPFKGTPFEQFFANMGGNFGALFGPGGQMRRRACRTSAR